jgi:hypothetical protein
MQNQEAARRENDGSSHEDGERDSRREWEDGDVNGDEDCCHKPKAYIPRLMPFAERRTYLERRRREQGGIEYARASGNRGEETADDDDDDEEEDEDKYVSAVHRLSQSYDDRIQRGAAVAPSPEIEPAEIAAGQPRVYKDPDVVAQSVSRGFFVRVFSDLHCFGGVFFSILLCVDFFLGDSSI